MLQRPGAVGKLLGIAAKSADAEELSDALMRALGGVTLPQAASMDELRRMLHQVRALSAGNSFRMLHKPEMQVKQVNPVHFAWCCGCRMRGDVRTRLQFNRSGSVCTAPIRYNHQCRKTICWWRCMEQANGAAGERIQELAVACLGQYAESSVVNCGKIAVVGGGPALGAVALGAARQGQRYGLEAQLTRVMGVLARDCPIRCVLLPAQPQLPPCMRIELKQERFNVLVCVNMWAATRPRLSTLVLITEVLASRTCTWHRL